MTTTLRATLAIAFLIGFYALVGVVIAATVAFDILAIQHPNAGAFKIAIIATIAAFALLRALLVMSKRQDTGEHGFPIMPQDEPVLWHEVSELAARVGTAPPEEIRLVPDVNAAVSEDTRMLGLRAVRRRMYIGLPLLATLTAAEMRGVLGLLAAQSQRFTDEAAAQERSPYDSHPSLPERLAAIARLPEPAVRPDDRPAWVLLTNPAAAEHVSQQALWTPEARQLPSLPWEEIIARGVYASSNAEAVADLLVGAQRITGWPEPTLAGALAVLEHGDVERLSAELRNLGWPDAETKALVANVVTGALQGIFVETGQATWTLSWSGPAQLLDRRGEDIRLGELAQQAVDNPGAVQAVRHLLGRYGIPDSHRPALLPAPA